MKNCGIFEIISRRLFFILTLFAIGTINLATLLAADPKIPSLAANSALFEAARSGDLAALQTALVDADVNATDENGQTALMVATEKGQFECAKELLWHGAEPLLADKKGNTAMDLLDPKSESYLINNLLLRCFALVKKQGTISRKPVTPNLVLVNDNFVDFNNPEIKPHYHINTREQAGKTGKDDDGNGFIDDVYGWRIEEDAPIVPSDLSLAQTEAGKEFAVKLFARMEAAAGNQQSREALRESLRQSHDNPLVRQIGFDNLEAGEVDLSDLRYSAMLKGASHGTHVAGIVLRESRGKAQIHCLSIGRLGSPDLSPMEREETLRDLAFQSPTYTEYVDRLLDKVRDYSLKKGQRCSEYIKQLSAGVANLSWGLPRSDFERGAKDAAETYRKYGQDPRTMADFKGPTGRSRSSDLGLELMASNAAAFALVCYENPDVLFVVAAGNNERNNDVEVCSPPYLSRFFPNVITVASINRDDGLSKFSNYGLKSVQIAAPGDNISSTMLYGATGSMSGTSMAAPAVSGAAALLREENPGLSALQIREVLEAAAKKLPDLEGKVTTGGCLNTDRALQIARLWHIAGKLVAKLDVRLRSTPEKGIPAVSKHEEEKEMTEPFTAVDEAGSGWRVSALGGFGNSWRVVVDEAAEGEKQLVSNPGSFPSSSVLKHRAEGYGIAAVAGDFNGWSVLLSKSVPSEQTMVGYTLDLPAIEERLKQGLRIRTLAGWRDCWIVVMDRATGWGEQIVIPPGPLDEGKKQILAAKMKSGYSITSIAGDDAPDNDDDGWAFVLTKGGPYSEQFVDGPDQWSEEWVAEQNAKGYKITGVTGIGLRWVLVMSKTSAPVKQLVGPAGEFPRDWLRHPQGEGGGEP